MKNLISRIRYLVQYLLGLIGIHGRYVFSDNPSMSELKINFLERQLNKEDILLEFGAGGSTRFFSQRLKHVFTVETDRNYLKMAIQGLDNVSGVFVHIGPTWHWGFPLFPLPKVLRQRFGSKYSSSPWLAIKRTELNPTSILIDGRFRVASCLQCLLKSGTKDKIKIFFDDFSDREEYQEILKVCDVEESVENLVRLSLKSDFSDLSIIHDLYEKYKDDPR